MGKILKIRGYSVFYPQRPLYISTTFLDLSYQDEFKNICNFLQTLTVKKSLRFEVLKRLEEKIFEAKKN
jgi:hypothetical protein